MKIWNTAFALLLCPLLGMSQDDDAARKAAELDQESIFDFFKSDARKARDSLKAASKKNPNKKIYIAGIPTISSSPITGVSIGAALNGAFVMGGNMQTTRFSTVNLVGAVTGKGQKVLSLSEFLYFKDEEWILHGSLNWRIFPMFTWGLGGNTPDAWGGQIENDGITFDQVIQKKIGDKWYLGAGINLDWIYKQTDENLNATIQHINDNRGSSSATQYWNSVNDDLPFVIKENQIPQQFITDWNNPSVSAENLQTRYFQTPMHLYPYGVGDEVFYMGFMIGITHDTRDNLNYTRKGTYFNFNYNIFPKSLSNGGQNWSLARFDVRKFWRINTYKNVLGAKLYAASAFGGMPYTGIPASATDEGSGQPTRGYVSYRYRGDRYISTEVEFRRDIWKFLQGVVFVNAHTISERSDYLRAMGLDESDDGKFRYINPGYGLGLKVLLNEKSQVSFSIDYAWNKFSFSGKNVEGKEGVFYMGLNCAF